MKGSESSSSYLEKIQVSFWLYLYSFVTIVHFISCKGFENSRSSQTTTYKQTHGSNQKKMRSSMSTGAQGFVSLLFFFGSCSTRARAPSTKMEPKYVVFSLFFRTKRHATKISSWFQGSWKVKLLGSIFETHDPKGRLPSLKLPANAPESRHSGTQKETHLPTIHLQVQTISFREDKFKITTPVLSIQT